jgi:protein RecA
MTVDKIIDKLKKTYKGALPDVSEAGVVKRLILSSPKMNYIFGGGFPLQRMIQFYGPESGGKTVLASYIAGQFQKRTDGGNKLVIFVDMEHTFDLNYAKTVGCDTVENFAFIRPLNGEEGFTIVEELVKDCNVGLIIWDSIAATPSASQMADEYGKASFGGTAKVFADGLKKLNPYLSRFNSAMILTNQVRAQIGGYIPPGGTGENITGGKAHRFYSSWMARVSRSQDYLDKKEIIGNGIRIKNTKSKVGFPKRSAELDLYYSTGFNPDNEYIDFIINLGLVKVAGSWLSNEEWDFKGQGRDSLLEFLRNKPELFDECKDKVNSSFATHTILDEKEADETDSYVAEEEI